MKILSINGRAVHTHGTDGLTHFFSECPKDRPAELVVAYRMGNWWDKADKKIVQVAPPFGLDLPFVSQEECCIIRVDGVEAYKAGIRAGMKIVHVEQGGKTIYAKDLDGKQLVEGLTKLNKGVMATISLAVFATGTMRVDETETRMSSLSITSQGDAPML